MAASGRATNGESLHTLTHTLTHTHTHPHTHTCEGVVQYNEDVRAWEGAKATNITVNVLCDVMNDKLHTPLEK